MNTRQDKVTKQLIAGILIPNFDAGTLAEVIHLEYNSELTEVLSVLSDVDTLPDETDKTLDILKLILMDNSTEENIASFMGVIVNVIADESVVDSVSFYKYLYTLSAEDVRRIVGTVVNIIDG